MSSKKESNECHVFFCCCDPALAGWSCQCSDAWAGCVAAEDWRGPDGAGARENFRHVEGCVVEDRKDKNATHQLNTKLAPGTTGRIRTTFDEFVAAHARYDMEVRYLDEKGGPTRFGLLVNGTTQGTWETKGEGRGWTTKTIRDLEVIRGNEIRLDIEGAPGRLDYVQLNLR